MYIYLVQYYIAIFYPKVSTNMNVLRIINLSFLRNLLMLHVLTAVSVWLTVPQLLQHGEVCNAMQTKAKGSFSIQFKHYLLNILCIAQIVFPQVNSFQALINTMAVPITEISH